MSAAPPSVWPDEWPTPPPSEPERDPVQHPDNDPTEPATRPDRDDVAAAMACPVDGCGTPLADAGGFRRGWVLVRIVGSGDPPRRYCSGSCATKGIAHVELGNHRDQQPLRRPATVTDLPRHTNPQAAAYQGGNRVEAALIRAWAVAAGYEVPVKGRIPNSIRLAFIDAHTETGATA